MTITYRVIDPKSISFEAVKEDLEAHIQSKEDADAWKDFYASGAGTTAVELMSGLGVYAAFHSFGARRDSYIDTARLRSSLIHLSNTLGYPVNRKATARLNLEIEVTAAGFWDREEILTTWGSRSISLLNSQTLSLGVQTVECIVGEWRSWDFKSAVEEPFYMLEVLAEGIDNNRFGDTLSLWVNSQPVRLTKYADEMDSNSVLVNTGVDSIILIFGDDFIGYQIRNSDNLSLNYVLTYGALGVEGIEPSEVSPLFEGTVTAVSVLDPGSDEDSAKKLAAVAPGYYASKRRMVSGRDHEFILKSYSGDLISAGHEKQEGVCCTIQMSYLFSDEHVASSLEVESILAYLNPFKMVGEQILLVEPSRVGLDLKMFVVIQEGLDAGEVEAALYELLEGMVWKLGSTFYLGRFIMEASNLEGIIRVYVEKPYEDKILSYDEYLKVLDTSEIILTTDLDSVFNSIENPDSGYLDQIPSVVLNNPTGEIVALLPTFEWDIQVGAVKYDLWLNDITDGVSEVLRIVDLNTNSYTTLDALIQGHLYTWWVRGSDGSVWSAWSPGKDFNIV